MNLTLRSILLVCALLASTGSLFAAGEYQQVREGKTLVWNGMPRPGDTATWSGEHDRDNYATGFGDLTWYDASGKEQALLYGNMVRGKFEGPVNMHANGRTMHAYYTNGGRVTGWSRGRAPSNMPAPAEAAAEKRKAEADTAKPEIGKAAESESTPVIKKAKPVTEAKAEPTPPPSRERATRGPDTYHKETAEKPAIVAEKKNEPMPIPTPPTLHETAPADSAHHSTTEPATPDRASAEPSALPKSSAESTPAEATERPTPQLPIVVSTQPAQQETPPVLHEQKSEVTDQRSDVSPDASNPSVAEIPPALHNQKAEATDQSPVPAKENPADVSVNALAGPPPSLRPGAIPESSPEKQEPPRTPKPEGPLTESEVISLVETDARNNGAPIEQYEQPKVDHSTVRGKWTLFYERKPEANAQLPAAFTATVEDKTHKVKVEIRR